MKQLGGEDHLWFAMETESTPMHLVQAGIYEPSPGKREALELDGLRRFVRERLGGLPLRRKLVTVPLHADFPYWVEDENFDLDEHIREIELPSPGGWAEFQAELVRLIEEPLDSSRPLWEMILVRGFESLNDVTAGSVALVTKVHHGQFDGTSIVRLFARLHSLQPVEDLPRAQEWTPERIPGALELLAWAPWNHYKLFWKRALVLWHNAPNLAKRLLSLPFGQNDGDRFTVPKTRFARTISSRDRVFGFLAFPLPGLKAIRLKVVGATVNDTALAVLTGALHHYLSAYGELPDEPIRIGIPVSAHTIDEPEDTGNRFALMFVTLPTGTSEPIWRLHEVRESTKESKRASMEMGVGNVADLIDVLPTNLMDVVIEQLDRIGLADRLSLGMSGIGLTNVPGPAEPLYLDGARLVRSLGCTFLTNGEGLIVLVSTYCDEVTIQFVSTPEMMPDPDFFKECLRKAYEELADA
jgi:WS/DGAT/MGAT family acyltransferase